MRTGKRTWDMAAGVGSPAHFLAELGHVVCLLCASRSFSVSERAGWTRCPRPFHLIVLWHHTEHREEITRNKESRVHVHPLPSNQATSFHEHRTWQFTKCFHLDYLINFTYWLISVRIANIESKSSMECTQDALTNSAGRNRRDRERQPEILRHSISEIKCNLGEREYQKARELIFTQFIQIVFKYSSGNCQTPPTQWGLHKPVPSQRFSFTPGASSCTPLMERELGVGGFSSPYSLNLAWGL